MKKVHKGCVLVIFLLALIIGILMGNCAQQTWADSPIFTPVVKVYVPSVVRNWDGTPAPTATATPLPTITPTTMPKYQGVGHHRQWVQDEADWLCPYLMAQTEVTDYYDWTPYPIVCDGITAHPMIWDEAQIGSTIGGNSEWLQIFSEPEPQFNQADMTPIQGAINYHDAIAAYPGFKYVGPAVVYIQWLYDFVDAYDMLYGTTPPMDALAIHLYPQVTGSYYNNAAGHIANSAARLDEMIAFATLKGVPEVWVTEFTVQPVSGGEDGYQDSIAYMVGMVDVFQSRPMVTHWFWFGLDLTGFWYWPTNPELSELYDTSLIHGFYDPELTGLGQAYAN